MPKQRQRKDIDDILRHWPFTPGDLRVRAVKASDGREVLQMRVELGVLQLETSKRPDGETPSGAETYLDFLISEAIHNGEQFQLSEEQCLEVDREFIQFYHRRICWLHQREFERAVTDADHTLALMDFVGNHSPDEEWTWSHEQYRPFVLFHRTQAAAMSVLDGPGGAEEAIGEINRGLRRIREFFENQDRLEDVEWEEIDLVQALKELRESLREEYNVGKTLKEQLADAVAEEQYELAARLRDQIRQRHKDAR